MKLATDDVFCCSGLTRAGDIDFTSNCKLSPFFFSQKVELYKYQIKEINALDDFAQSNHFFSLFMELTFCLSLNHLKS